MFVCAMFMLGFILGFGLSSVFLVPVHKAFNSLERKYERLSEIMVQWQKL